MTEQITPRKRKAVAGETPNRSGIKGKGRAAPTPNPPLVPFPTPPRSRHRKAEYFEPDLGPSTFDSASTSLSSPQASKLPAHLETLLTLHRAFNLALSLHLATHPPVLPPHSPTATSVQLPNLTNLLSIRETVGRTGCRRFGVAELQRLAWLWTWDGSTMPEERSAKDKASEDDNPFLVTPPSAGTSHLDITGLSYLINPTRTLDPSTGRKVYTYGLGIVLDLRRGETRQLLHGGAEGGIGNKGQGGGLGAVGRWSGAGEEREEIMRERLDKWVELNGGFENEPSITSTGLPTPAATRENTRSTIPPIPLLPLPHLPASTLLPTANLFSSALASSSSSGLSPAKKATMTGQSAPGAGLADAFEIDNKAEKGKVARLGSVEERRLAMMERIKARKNGKAPQQSLASQIAGGPQYSLSRAETTEELKRRSTLSRLESVAEGVWMMFSAPTAGSSSLSTPPRGRRRAVPMSEAAEVIVKSSKTPISIAEAQTSLTLLTELCPFFLTLKTIAKQDWLEMPAQVAQVPSSPNNGILASARLASNITSPSRNHLRGLMTSPGGVALRNEVESEMNLSTGVGAIAGPASPGRVRRVGGLREVRERIRRELGE